MMKDQPSMMLGHRNAPRCLDLSPHETTCDCGGGQGVHDLDLLTLECCAQRAHIMRAADALTFRDCLRVRVPRVAWGAMAPLLSAGFRYRVTRSSAEASTVHVWRFLQVAEQVQYHRSRLAYDPEPRTDTTGRAREN